MKYLAYYTVFCGSDWQCKGVAYPVGRIPPTPSEAYDCYYFTNNINLYNKIKETRWIPVFIDKQHTDDILSSTMLSKEPKAAPHHFKELTDYEYLVYQDSKMGIKGDDTVLDLIKTYSDKYMIVTRIHPSTFSDPSIYRELNTSMLQQRYLIERPKYDMYIQNQINQGFTPYDTSIHLTGYIIRNCKHPRINEFNEMWYQHIQECGIQCQLSFYFVKQRFKDLVIGITEEVTNTLPPLTSDIF